MTNISTPAPTFVVQESDIDIAKRISQKARVFSGGKIQLLATAEQFETLVREIVSSRTRRILAALDGMDRGCTVPGFSGHKNGYGESEPATNCRPPVRNSLPLLPLWKTRKTACQAL